MYVVKVNQKAFFAGNRRPPPEKEQQHLDSQTDLKTGNQVSLHPIAQHSLQRIQHKLTGKFNILFFSFLDFSLFFELTSNP